MKSKILPRRSLLEAPKTQPMPENRGGKLRLDMNENVFGCSPKARAALRRMRSAELAMYPEKGIAISRLAPFFGAGREETLLVGGIDEALRLIADVFLERGRSALLVEPTFPMYRFYAQQRDARVSAFRYGDGMQFPLDAVLKALRAGPTVFFLANPNNPTGSSLGKRELGKILDAARRTLVVVDEAYFEFSGATVLPWVRRRRNLIVTRTFSKAAGLAGLRLGCIFAHTEISKFLHMAQAPFPVSSAALVCGEAALRDKNFIRRCASENRRNLEYLIGELTGKGIRVFPSAANFVLADFGERGPEIVSRLGHRGILVKGFAKAFRRDGPVRITVGRRAQIRRLLRELEKIL